MSFLKGRKTAYRDYLMERHGYTHKEAMIEAELIAEDEYDSYYEKGLKLESGDEFNLYDRRYAVLNFDENKQEVLVRDITRPDEENLPLYYVMDIPYVYQRTQAKNDLLDVTLEDFLNGDVSFTDVTFGDGDETSVYTYGELKVHGAVFPMDYTVDSEWTDADIDNGKRRAYREYLIEVMEYSEKMLVLQQGYSLRTNMTSLQASLPLLIQFLWLMKLSMPLLKKLNRNIKQKNLHTKTRKNCYSA